MIDASHAAFARFARVMLPRGGHAFAMIEGYFDESGSHEGAPILCVGGYLFERDNCIDFDGEWKEMLKDFHVPYFRMAPCEAGGLPFDKTPSELRAGIVERASRAANKWMAYGIVIAVNEQEYNEIMPNHPLIGSAYSFIAKQTFNAVRVWADRTKYDGPVSYFFEAGHRHQDDTDKIMREHAAAPEVKSGARYYSHGFLKKQEARPLQAADLLAWHYGNDWARKLRGKASRESYQNLIGSAPLEKYWHFHWTKTKLRKQAKRAERLIKKYPDAGQELFGNG